MIVLPDGRQFYKVTTQQLEKWIADDADEYDKRG
jgi:hypothetical protein